MRTGRWFSVVALRTCGALACASGTWTAPLPAQSAAPTTPTTTVASPAARGGAVQPAAPIAGAGDLLRVEVLAPGNSSRAMLRAAADGVPLNRLQPADRQRARTVLSSISLYRRLPTVRCEVDPRVYTYFTTHPDVAVSIWRAMDVSNLQMRQTGPLEYEADAGDGTQGVISLLYRGPDCCLIHCDGQFTNPVVKKPIRAQGLMCLYTEFSRTSDGRTLATNRADIFVTFPSQTVETVARLIAPVSNRIADRNLEELSLFLRFMDAAMTTQPGWVEDVSTRLDGLLPGRREQLLQLTAEVYVDGQRQMQARNGQDPSLELILPPVRSASGETTAPIHR